MTPTFEELKRLREAATQPPFGKVTEYTIADFRIQIEDTTWDQPNSEFLSYAANHAVDLLQSEREHADRLTEALKNAAEGVHFNENHVSNTLEGCSITYCKKWVKMLAEHGRRRR